jgi:hypothetical protein
VRLLDFEELALQLRPAHRIEINAYGMYRIES